MMYSINIPNDGKTPVEMIKPENASVMEDLLALGFLAKCIYDGLDSDEDREQYISGIQALTNPELYKKESTTKA